MAKLKAPLMSLGASGALGKALVFFPWKGLDVVREYVIPANPKSDAQIEQRDWLKDAVTAIHAAQALTDNFLDETDIIAYALLGSTYPTPRTWFNTIVKQWLDMLRLTLKPGIWRNVSVAESSEALTVTAFLTDQDDTMTFCTIKYGKSKTALVNRRDTNPTELEGGKEIPGLTKNVKYFIQIQGTTPDGSIGVNSGIYYGTPTA